MEFLKSVMANPMFWVIASGIILTVLGGMFSKTRKIVYAAVIWAEQTFIGAGRGDEKRVAVVNLVYGMVPAPFRWAVSKWVLSWLIEAGVKYLEDWLDDGVINNKVPSGVANWLGEIFYKLDMEDSPPEHEAAAGSLEDGGEG